MKRNGNGTIPFFKLRNWNGNRSFLLGKERVRNRSLFKRNGPNSESLNVCSLYIYCCGCHYHIIFGMYGLLNSSTLYSTVCPFLYGRKIFIQQSDMFKKGLEHFNKCGLVFGLVTEISVDCSSTLVFSGHT